MIILLYIIGFVFIGAAIALLYWRYSRLELIVRRFLHDLRNHLMAFDTFHQAFPLEPDQKALQKLAVENKILFLQLNAYIHGFETYMKSERYKNIPSEVIELNALLRQRKAFIDRCDYAHRYQWDFDIPDRPFILKANPYLLNCLMDNLMGNALKHSKKNGRISIVLKEHKKKGRLIIRNEKGQILKVRPGGNQGLYFVKKISPQLRSKIAINDEKRFYTVTCDFE